MVGATILPKYFSAAANSGIHALSYHSDSRSSKEDGGEERVGHANSKRFPFRKILRDKTKNPTDTDAKISSMDTKYFNIVPQDLPSLTTGF